MILITKKILKVLLWVFLFLVLTWLLAFSFHQVKKHYVRSKYSYLCEDINKYNKMMTDIKSTPRMGKVPYTPEEVYDLILYDLYCVEEVKEGMRRNYLRNILLNKDVEAITLYLIEKVKGLNCDENNTVTDCDKLEGKLYEYIDYNTELINDFMKCDLDLLTKFAIYRYKYPDDFAKHYRIKEKIYEKCLSSVKPTSDSEKP